MKTPKYWNNKNLIAYILYPFGILCAFATTLRLKLVKPKRIDKPVICIGNLTAGGTGKTPVAISIAKMLQSAGKKPFFISRGYGGTLKGITIDNQKHTARESGDEPLLLSRQAPIVVDSDRFQAALKASNEGADVVIMDDGFQNPSLYKDLSFIVIDAASWFGNGFCIPAGPLREPVDSGAERADAFLIIGNQFIGTPPIGHKPQYKFLSTHHDKLHFYGHIVPIPPAKTPKKVLAFAGIGKPEKFYNSLGEIGIRPIDTIDFPDHHYYTETELNAIISRAEKIDAEIFTTAKDMVKIPAHLRKYFNVLEIEIKWQDEKKLKEFIMSQIIDA